MAQLAPILFALWAAYTFGPEIGYRYWSAHDPFSAAFYGGGSVFFVAWPLGIIVAWPCLRLAGAILFGGLARAQLLARRQIHAEPIIPADRLDALLIGGMVFTYAGLVDRDFTYQDGRSQKARIRAAFTLRRNTAAMTPREREGVRIFETLRAENLLGRDADRLRFALAWGDGRAEVKGSRLPRNRATEQNGLHSLRSLIAAEGRHRDISTEAAISQLYTVMQEAVASPLASPRLVKLGERYKVAPFQPVAAQP